MLEQLLAKASATSLLMSADVHRAPNNDELFYLIIKNISQYFKLLRHSQLLFTMFANC
jgi:hypothetical protein